MGGLACLLHFPNIFLFHLHDDDEGDDVFDDGVVGDDFGH